jgi:hypothetical protein
MKPEEFLDVNDDGAEPSIKNFKVTEDSPIYKERFSDEPYQSHPLGRSLFYLEEVKARGTDTKAGGFEAMQLKQDEKALKSIKDFLARASHPEVRKAIDKLINEVYSKGSLEVRQQMFYWLAVKQDKSGGRPVNFFGGISDQFLTNMLREHGRIFREKQKQLEGEFSRWSKENIPKIQQELVKIGVHLPAELIEARVSTVRVYISDPLRDMLRNVQWQGGYSPSSHAIYISGYEFGDGKNEQRLYATLTHEFLHALSGKTLLQWIGALVTEQKTGLGFTAGEETQFGWLAEAVTEDLTNKIRNTKEQESHQEEQELFSLLQSSGSKSVPAELFYLAYFENYDPAASDRKESAIPKWHALRNAINEAYSPTFLVNLDKFINKFGTEEAVVAMEKENGWKEIENLVRSPDF